jgi:hypothetical protein
MNEKLKFTHEKPAKGHHQFAKRETKRIEGKACLLIIHTPYMLFIERITWTVESNICAESVRDICHDIREDGWADYLSFELFSQTCFLF